METLFISTDCVLRREDNTLVVKPEAGPKRRIPIETLRHVVVAGECEANSTLLELLGRSGVRMTVLDWHGNVSGTFEPFGSPRSGAVRLRQAAAILDEGRRLAIATSIVSATIRNEQANLRYRMYRGVGGLDGHIAKLGKLVVAAAATKSIAELMGVEGSARAWYLDGWKVIGPELDFGPRVRRPPNNPANCLLSWFNARMYSAVRNEIGKTHLDDCLSFLHAPTQARHSLALDLAEVFKVVVCDTLVMEMLSKGQARDSWFQKADGACRLSEEGRKQTLDAWVRKLGAAEESGSYLSLIRDDALGLERHLLGMADFKPHVRRV